VTGLAGAALAADPGYDRAVLRSITLHRYRAFEDASASLGPLTAFVGPNASGKSSLLRACVGGQFGARDVRGMQGVGRIVRGKGNRSEEASFTRGASPALRQMGPLLHLRPSELREERTVVEARSLDATGANLVNVLATMPRRRREALAEQFVQLVPVFADVDVRPASAGKHRVVFQDRWAPDVWYEPSEVSDGSLFALALLSLAYQPEPTHLVAIEEPEHGLHPHLLSSIVDLMRTLSVRPVAPMQIVLATQSSELLDLLKPEEVRFLTRRADGSVTIDPASTDTERWKEAYEAHQSSLASLWLSGAVGGVPWASRSSSTRRARARRPAPTLGSLHPASRSPIRISVQRTVSPVVRSPTRGSSSRRRSSFSRRCGRGADGCHAAVISTMLRRCGVCWRSCGSSPISPSSWSTPTAILPSDDARSPRSRSRCRGFTRSQCRSSRDGS
jgi:hypothetical protein